MTDSLEEFAEKLQQEIFEETRKHYGDTVFQHWVSPKFMGALEDANGVARIIGKCGDTMEFYLKISGECVEKAYFWTDGCGSSTACGSITAELASGKTIDEISEIDGQTILDMVGGLPPEEHHCAYLAAEALQQALHDYLIKKAKAKTNPE